MAVRIVTDSASDLSEDLAEAHGITVVPLIVRFGDEELLDRREISVAYFTGPATTETELPQTAAVLPGAFQEAFVEAADEGCEAVVCITISAAMSATAQSAMTAAEATGDRIPVHVVDSRSVTMGEGLLALTAAEVAAAGAGVDEVLAVVENAKARGRVLGVLGSLDFLRRGGRIGAAGALVGSLLSIKPVIQVRNGEVAEESKQRTRARSLEYLVEKVRSDAPLERLAVVNGAADDLDAVVAKLADVEVTGDRIVVEMGPTVGTHTGPGTIGLCYQVVNA